MRPLTDFEKEILSRVIEYHNSGSIPNFSSILYPQLTNKLVFLDYVNSKAEIRTTSNIPVNIILKEIGQLTVEIVTSVSLFKYLESSGYVTLYLSSKAQNDTIAYGQLPIAEGSVHSDINDPVTTSLLLDYSFKSILVGQPLIDFVNNNFRTHEQIQTSRENFTNRRNLQLALIALVASTIMSFGENFNGCREVKYAKLQVEQEQTVRLNNNQVLFLDSNFQINKTSLDSVIKILDSIKESVKIKKSNKVNNKRPK